MDCLWVVFVGGVWLSGVVRGGGWWGGLEGVGGGGRRVRRVLRSVSSVLFMYVCMGVRVVGWFGYGMGGWLGGCPLWHGLFSAPGTLPSLSPSVFLVMTCLLIPSISKALHYRHNQRGQRERKRVMTFQSGHSVQAVPHVRYGWNEYRMRGEQDIT